MNKQRTVGFLIILFVTCLFSFGLWLKGNPFRQSYEIEIMFPNVHGLHKGSIVEYEGFRCGQVTGFAVLDHGIIVKARIEEPDVKIFQSDRFIVIPSSTIASEYQIYIERGIRPAPRWKSGMRLKGETPPGFQDYMYGAKDAIENLNSSLISLKSIMQKTNNDLDKLNPMLNEIEKIGRDGTISAVLKNTQETTEKTNTLLIANEQNILQITSNINAITFDINRKLKIIKDEDLVAEIKSLKAALQNLQDLTSAIKPEDVKNVAQTIDETKKILSKTLSAQMKF